MQGVGRHRRGSRLDEPHVKNYRTLSPDQLLKWAENNTEIMRLRTDRDLLPGGYMAALAQMLAAWNDSR